MNSLSRNVGKKTSSLMKKLAKAFAGATKAAKVVDDTYYGKFAFGETVIAKYNISRPDQRRYKAGEKVVVTVEDKLFFSEHQDWFERETV